MENTFLRGMQGSVRLEPGSSEELAANMQLSRSWQQDICQVTLTNKNASPVRVREVVLFHGDFDLSPDCAWYGEGYQMLSQTNGSLEQPRSIGSYRDHEHYKLEQLPEFFTAYNLVTFQIEPARHLLLAFTSCRRFSGLFRVNPGSIEVVMETEGLVLAPGQRWNLEEFMCGMGADREQLLSRLAERIQQYHPRLTWPGIPTGWCSWYGYGPEVSEQNIQAAMRAIGTALPDLQYIQIDDGYQRYMGDWLTPGTRFPRGVKALCRGIHAHGFEPAIWVAPFIAEQESQVLKEHPDWFVQDDAGQPLSSAAISFGGWRKPPWYMLDGTHPGAQAYLERVFRTMREEWGCRYFKLDALTWGALPGGRRYDQAATRIEAYRQGMAALQRGAGDDSLILGCNAPLWASLGTVHAMRVSGDIARRWSTVETVARETFWRNWQHGRLWINDPDCVVLTNQNGSTLTPDEILFHATAIAASGGMVLSGDRVENLSDEQWNMLGQLLPPTGRPARFDDLSQCIGRTQVNGELRLYLFNWDDDPRDLQVPLSSSWQLTDIWSGADLGLHDGEITLKQMPPHSARLLSARRPADWKADRV
ncbi:glycoside hydrolase family 36 protein [Dictyobacter formicarum]|uniref:Alpha-galactosidase n=1 Tax=Dictyobacter formicarum TaxID=2778368 RepID=A0ABQ3VI39_9CHLR|nr:glycoside hydrolase family 36 protein [Dictyobacter formicarum]GHO85859.1 alpha-galactosidase [Dictyobacter formicarum]